MGKYNSVQHHAPNVYRSASITIPRKHVTVVHSVQAPPVHFTSLFRHHFRTRQIKRSTHVCLDKFISGRSKTTENKKENHTTSSFRFYDVCVDGTNLQTIWIGCQQCSFPGHDGKVYLQIFSRTTRKCDGLLTGVCVTR